MIFNEKPSVITLNPLYKDMYIYIYIFFKLYKMELKKYMYIHALNIFCVLIIAIYSVHLRVILNSS